MYLLHVAAIYREKLLWVVLCGLCIWGLLCGVFLESMSIAVASLCPVERSSTEMKCDIYFCILLNGKMRSLSSTDILRTGH